MGIESAAPGPLYYYRKVGRCLLRVRYLLAGLLVVFALLSVNLLFAGPATSERFLLPALVLTTWFVLSLSFAYYFANIDLSLHPGTGGLARLGHWFRKAFTYLLAASFTIASLLLLYFSLTAIRVATGS